MMVKSYLDIKVDVKVEDLNKENIIYCFTFPNGKVYIGQTIKKLRIRLVNHIGKALCEKSNTYNTYKSNAIRKYKMFNVDILYQGEDLDNQEVYYINKFNSTNKEFGYNLESGGNLNKHHSEETKLKIGKANKGKDGPNKRSVIVTELSTGIETRFDSITLAKNYYSIASIGSIHDVLSGRNKTFKNKQYTVRYE